MESAVESGAHEGLNDLEYAFLVELAREGDAEKAAVCVGVGGEAMKGLMRNLARMDLIEIEKGNRVHLLPELREMLLLDPRNGKTMSVLGKPKAVELYRTLKRAYAFVFPEVPLAAFIRVGAAESIIAEKADRWYFLTCRVDFLVCDRDGFPRLVFEYQGGGHAEEDNRKRDALKRKFLEAAGIPLHEVGSGKMEKLPPVDQAAHVVSTRTVLSEWGKTSLGNRFETFLGTLVGVPQEPDYPTTWNHLKKEYVAVMDFKDGKIGRRLLGQKINRTRDNRSADLQFAAEEIPGRLPVGTILEIRDGSHKHLFTSYFRKHADSWRLLKRKEGTSTLFQKTKQTSEKTQQ